MPNKKILLGRLGRQAMYPWDKWLSYKNQFTLRRGVHYNCTTQSMSLQVRNRAAREGMRAHIHQEEGLLVIQLERITDA